MKTIGLYNPAGQWYKVLNNDPLDELLADLLGSSVKMVKTVNVTRLMTHLLACHQHPGFSFAFSDVTHSLPPSRQSFDDGGLSNAHFLCNGPD